MIVSPVVVGYQLVKPVSATKIQQNPYTNATSAPAKKEFLFAVNNKMMGITAI